MRRRIALVVPALGVSAGVGSVANFLLRTIKNSSRYDVKLISLAMSSRDRCSILLHRPRTWLRGVTVETGEHRGEIFHHVGANAGEIETQRLKPRAALTALLRDCDLIQVVAGMPSWSLPVLGLGKPVVLQVATLAAVERRRRQAEEHGAMALWRRLMTNRVALLDERALGRVDAIMVENPWMLEYAKARNTRAIVQYAPPGINLAAFTPPAHRELAPGYILCVGRLGDARKNIDLLLDAYARLCRATSDPPDLVLAGYSAPPPAFWQRVASLQLSQRITFLPNVSLEQLKQLYAGATLFASSSDEEGFGVAIVEAMASGIPVVSTKSGGPDGIITDGHDGFLVPVMDVEAFANRLAQLSKDVDRNRIMGKNARVTVETKFEEVVAGDRYLEVYDRLLRQDPQAGVAT